MPVRGGLDTDAPRVSIARSSRPLTRPPANSARPDVRAAAGCAAGARRRPSGGLRVPVSGGILPERRRRSPLKEVCLTDDRGPMRAEDQLGLVLVVAPA